MSWRPSSKEVLPAEFAETASKNHVAVFHVWAPWNAYDQTMDIRLGKIAAKYGNQIFLGSIDYDDPGHWQMCREAGALNLPALVSFVNGKHFETVIGLCTEEDLDRRLQALLNTADRDHTQ